MFPKMSVTWSGGGASEGEENYFSIKYIPLKYIFFAWNNNKISSNEFKETIP